MLSYHHHLKRRLDFAGAVLGLVLFSPALIIIALAVRVGDSGPALFRQRRVGRAGITFELIKFRTMPVGTPHLPRAGAGTLTITTVGKVLRRFNLDELPQLFNIARGDMSFVGPRPALPAQHRLCALRSQTAAWNCVPGLTGLAQLHAYDGMPDDEKVEWDHRYASHITFSGDAAILLGTIAYLRRPPPVY